MDTINLKMEKEELIKDGSKIYLQLTPEKITKEITLLDLEKLKIRTMEQKGGAEANIAKIEAQIVEFKKLDKK